MLDFSFLDETFIILVSSALIFISCIVLTIKTRFIQIRAIPYMFRLIVRNFKRGETHQLDAETIEGNHALFTAMSTSIGIGNIVGPIIAIKLGGPGALLGFILASFFGAASTYTEVSLAVKHRKVQEDGSIMGGPMQYMSDLISPKLGYFYGFVTFILLVFWCSNQSNTLADLLEPFGVRKELTGAVLAGVVFVILIGGIRRVSEFATKIVPVMFVVYSLSVLSILAVNYDRIWDAISLIFTSFCSFDTAYGAGCGLGIERALRWGLAKGFQSNESGMGTASIPHSMSETKKPRNQGILSMAAVYSNGFLCMLTGLVVLVTETWDDPDVHIGINVVMRSFQNSFSHFGSFILIFCSTLFALTTILGNAYNGSQCFSYVSKQRGMLFYQLLICVVVFFGAMLDVEFVWTYVDFLVIPVALPQLATLLYVVFKNKDPELLSKDL